MKSEREETRHRYGKKADFYSPGGQIRSGDYEKRGRNGNVETCPYETRHRNNPGMARGWPSHDAKEERNASLSLSLFPFASPLLFLAPATIERKAGCSCTCCRTRLRSKFDRHPAGPGEKETIRNNKVEGTLVETLNVPRSSVPSKIRCIRECPVSAVRPSTRQVQGHPRLTKTTPPPLPRFSPHGSVILEFQRDHSTHLESAPAPLIPIFTILSAGRGGKKRLGLFIRFITIEFQPIKC